MHGVVEHKSSGFTLLELLVVLVIAGMLLALVPPMISSVMPGMELKSAARELTITLKEARLKAVSRGVTVVVTFFANPARYAVDDQAERKLPQDTQLAFYDLASAGTRRTPGFAAPTGEPQRLIFFPDGSSNGTVLELGNGDNRYAINVHWLTGKISVSRGGAGAH